MKFFELFAYFLNVLVRAQEAHLQQPTGHLVEHFRPRRRVDAQLRRGLVHEVDGLVGQEPPRRRSHKKRRSHIEKLAISNFFGETWQYQYFDFFLLKSGSMLGKFSK